MIRRTGMALVLGMLLLIAAPSAALAAGSSEATPVAPSQVTEVQCWMGAEPGEAVVIVAVTIPDTVELPATVRIPVIDGMNLDWAGEISGGDASEDIQRDYVIEAGANGGSYAELTLTDYHNAQIDFSGKQLVTDGDTVSAEFPFVQSVDSSATVFTVRVPAGVSDVNISPQPESDTSTNDSGETLYSLPTMTLATGESTTVSVSYSVGSSSGSTDSITLLAGVLAGVAAVVAVVTFVIAKRSRAREE